MQQIEETKKILLDEDLKAICEKIYLKCELLNVTVTFEKIVKKITEDPELKDMFNKVIAELNVNGIANKIEQDEDFKAFITEHEMENNNLSILLAYYLIYSHFQELKWLFEKLEQCRTAKSIFHCKVEKAVKQLQFEEA